MEFYFGDELHRRHFRCDCGRSAHNGNECSAGGGGGDVFGSLLVDANSPTPYTDATQVRRSLTTSRRLLY